MRMSKDKIVKLKGQFSDPEKPEKKQPDLLEVVKVLLTQQNQIAKENVQANKDNVKTMSNLMNKEQKVIIEQNEPPVIKKKWSFKHVRQVIDGKSVIVETVATEV